MTESKLTPFVYVLNEDERTPSVHIKHVVECTIKKLGYGIREMYKFPFHLRDDENNIDAHIAIYDSMKSLSVYLQILPEDHEKMSGKLKILTVKNDGTNLLLGECLMNKTTYTKPGWGIRDVVYHYHLQPYHKNGNMTLICEIYFNLTKNIKSFYVPSLRQNQMSKDYGILLSSEDFADITFKVDGKELKAHKIILSARSPVFNRMFKSDMVESQLGTVEITDIDFEVLQSVLLYIYTDRVDDIDAHAEELLAAAEKYQLDDLKEKCGVFLSKSLTVENAADRFNLADLYREDQLKSKAIQFINRYRQEVVEAEKWNATRGTHREELQLCKTS